MPEKVLVCPVCDEVDVETLYKDKWGEVCGCNECMKTIEYWDDESEEYKMER